MELTYKITNQSLEDPTVRLYTVEVRLCDQTYENSGLQHSNIDDAKYDLDTLSKLNHCPYVAKGTYVINHNDKVIVLLEPLVSLNTWITEMKNATFLEFWKYDQNTSKCIGVGTQLKKIMFQMAKALESVHKAQHYHRNITNGVMMGRDENIRICFFKGKDDAHSHFAISYFQLQDLRDFRSLLDRIFDMDRPKNDLELPDELQYFLSFFDKIPPLDEENLPNPRQLHALTNWIYSSILFWKQQRRLFFLDALNECLDHNISSLQQIGFLNGFKGWQMLLEGTTVNEISFKFCLHYNSQSIGGRGSTLKYGALEYGCNFGIIRFIKNYKKHYRAFYPDVKSEAEAVEFVTRRFPNFYERIYHDVFEYRNSLLKFGTGLATFDKILGGFYSFFDMDGCCE